MTYVYMYDFVHIPMNTYAYMYYVAVFRDNRFIVVVSCYDVVADRLTVQKAKDTVVRDVRKAVDLWCVGSGRCSLGSAWWREEEEEMWRGTSDGPWNTPPSQGTYVHNTKAPTYVPYTAPHTSQIIAIATVSFTLATSPWTE